MTQVIYSPYEYKSRDSTSGAGICIHVTRLICGLRLEISAEAPNHAASTSTFCLQAPPRQNLCPNHYTLKIHKMPATTAETLSLVTRNVSVAPLVLLSVADHYGRSAKGTRKRVVGVLLGQNDGKNVRVSNSFAGWS